MTSSATVSGGSLVAIGMMGQNVTVYAFNVVAARLLVPAEFGAMTALFGIILVGTVAALGLQAVIARRLSVAPENADTIIAATMRVMIAAACAVGVGVAATTVILTPLLKLDSYLPIILCGAALAPLTLMGAQAGIAQGTERWGILARIYLGNGVGRLTAGTIALVIDPTVTSGMIGIAIGSWLPVLAGFRLLRGHGTARKLAGGRSLVRDAVLSAHALLAYFVLSNLDSLLARNLFDAHTSGLYASGLILAKAALFLPQFVSVIVFGDLARDSTDRARARAVAIVAGFGALTVAGVAVLPNLALVLVGGDQYGEITDRLWLFALAGSLLAIVHLLVFDALARGVHGVVVAVWFAVAAVPVIAYGAQVSLDRLGHHGGCSRRDPGCGRVVARVHQADRHRGAVSARAAPRGVRRDSGWWFWESVVAALPQAVPSLLLSCRQDVRRPCSTPTAAARRSSTPTT